MEDRRAGLLLRALWRRLRMRQVDLAAKAGVSQSVVSRAERGHFDSLSLRSVRALFGAVDARCALDVRWRGGEADYLLDAVHAELGVAYGGVLTDLGWRILPEVTFLRLGERGSIDLLATRADVRAAVLVELKSEMTSFEQQQRRLDSKARIFASVVEERLGWRPRSVAVVLVLADTSTNRGRVQRVEPLIRSSLPARNIELRRWLKQPVGSIGGIWFLRLTRAGSDKRRRVAPHRVRKPRASSD